MDKVRTAVIGTGHFGRYHADKYAKSPLSQFVGVVDADPGTRETVAGKYGVAAFADHRELIGKVDAVSVVVPTVLHHDVARDLIDSGIHVLIEKPIAETVEQGAALVALADRRNVVLQVGHLQRFLLERLEAAEFVGTPLYIESVRIHPFKPRALDVSVVLDLMIHDIDLVLAFANSPVETIHAIGTPVVTDEEDIANVRLGFASGCVANITASRVSRTTERRMRLFGRESYVSIDLQNRRFAAMRRGDGEPWAPGLPPVERIEREYADGDDLAAEIENFLGAVQGKHKPLVDGRAGLQALDVALKIEEATRAHRERILKTYG
ncbi:MAG: UDP-N-acetyl-D-glucosamine dehydrogenase [Tagaea sp. CACIAM 22H2]|nr:UDP-N-acetyl-D-glucosamine dehydrogenase [Tagaea sp. CACIAM 22H2]